MFKVYAIESFRKDRIYIGYTNDICARLKYHNSGYVKSTYNDKPWRLVASENFEEESDARWAERSLKKSRGKRMKWMKKNRYR